MTISSKAGNLADRRGYHHGNLREALIEGAKRLIAERGPAGFTLSDAAKIAGVSPAAPYRHFKDRQALLREVAKQGFEALGARLKATALQAGAGGEGFFAMGKAYLAFAREEPAYYAAMFNTGQPEEPSSGQDDPGFAILQAAVARMLGTTDPAKTRPAALLVFALTHGLASLSAPGSIAAPGGVADPEKALEIGVSALLKGLPQVLGPSS
ncbi:TetR/AcrR family transcriptional regulator [Phreatobacter aquaticus]|uniref:TetR/AcrR family transcriptional regulator n=1 Tax=Phreatobacter aquaticus TaxID=2570229 RepID=A0A4D7QKR6_9HYPH|nr:TetR/AcrR family transcriptional regulator [Phreatobacter aquaticus]QCK88228.1 TetR/AcrR family transcriptional regulator [Phreatobacter aquaticus]